MTCRSLSSAAGRATARSTVPSICDMLRTRLPGRAARQASPAVRSPGASRVGGWLRSRAPLQHVVRCSALEDNANRSHTSSSPAKDPASLRSQRRWLKKKRTLRTEPDPADHDILELNVDGRQIITHRSTLTLMKGSRLAEMFRRGNEQQLVRDRDGRIFLDFNASAFQTILKYLRELKISNGNGYVPLPDIKPEDRSSFRALVEYLQLDIPCWQQDTAADEQLLAQLNELRHCIGTSAEAEQKVAALQAAVVDRLRATGCSSAVLAAAQQQQVQSHGVAAYDSPTAAAAKAAAAAAGGSAASSTTGAAKQSKKGEVLMQKPAPQGASGAPLPVDRSGVSQLYYITTRRDRHNGLSLAICTEEEHKAAVETNSAAAAAAAGGSSSSPKVDILCDVTWSDTKLTFSLVCKRQFRSMHVGATSRNQLRRKGMHIPHYGWKQAGHTYNAPPPQQPQQAFFPSTKRPSRPARSSSSPSSSSSSSSSSMPLDLTGELPTLWRKGDCVELVVDLHKRNRLALKVNGREVDHYSELPSHRSWCWYLALAAHEGDRNMSCVVFDRDAYDVFWGEYRVSRFRE